MVEAVSRVARHLPLLLTLLVLPSTVRPSCWMSICRRRWCHRADGHPPANQPHARRGRRRSGPGTIIDRNHDGVISTNEATAYAELLKRDLVVRLDERDVDLKVTSSNFPEVDELKSGWGIIQIEVYEIHSGSLVVGSHKLALENHHLNAVSEYLFNAALPKSEFIRNIASQKRNDSQSMGTIEFTFHPPTYPQANSSSHAGNPRVADGAVGRGGHGGVAENKTGTQLLCRKPMKSVILSPTRGCAAPSTDEKRRHSERYSAKNLGWQVTPLSSRDPS